MGVYVIFSSLEQPEVLQRLDKSVAARFPAHDVCKADDRLWFVSTDLATPKDIYDALHPGEEITSIIIMPVTSYWGMHKKFVWDWLASKGI